MLNAPTIALRHNNAGIIYLTLLPGRLVQVYFPEQRLVLKPRTIHVTTHATTFMNEGPNRFFGIRDSPYFKVGIQDFKSILGARFGIERMHRMRDVENNPEITGLGKNLGRDDGIKDPIRDPHESPAQKN